MDNYVAVKEALQKLYHLMDTVEGTMGMPEYIDIPLKDLFKTELHTYFMYLSAADGKISTEERSFMNYLFDMELSVQDYAKFINDNNIYSTDFEEQIPLTLQILTEFDKKASVLSGMTGESFEHITPIIMNFYFEAGKVFVSCDETDEREVQELSNYIKGIVEKLSDNLKETFGLEDEKEVAFVGSKKGKVNTNTNTNSTNSTYGPSIYKVGVDIPAGEYKVFADGGRGYFAICSDANGDEIVRNDNFNGQMYIDIYPGQFLELVRCYALSKEIAPLYCPENMYEPGEYIVGKEIPAGEYRMIAIEGRRGYYSIEYAIGNGDREIISNNTFTNAAYVSIREGQILQLSGCCIYL